MELDLELVDLTLPALRGRKPAALEVAQVGELTREDLAALSVERGIKQVPLKRLSERHHALARMLGSGVEVQESAYANGYEPARVHMLLQDEAFKELVEHYRIIPDAVYADLHQRLSGLSIDAADEIDRRMVEDANRDEGEAPAISTSQLLNIVTIGADRTGFGPATKSTHIHIHAGLAARLDAARKRVAQLRDITPEKASGPGQANGVSPPGPEELLDGTG